LSWKSLLAMPSQLISFFIQSTYNILPCPSNLFRRKLSVNSLCTLCKSPSATVPGQKSWKDLLWSFKIWSKISVGFCQDLSSSCTELAISSKILTTDFISKGVDRILSRLRLPTKLTSSSTIFIYSRSLMCQNFASSSRWVFFSKNLRRILDES